MCIIVAIPDNTIVSRKTLYNCWSNNNDGAGLMYAEDGEVKIFKEFVSFSKFYAEYERIQHLETAKVLHFRIGTSGTKNEYNIHPFQIHDDTWFVHNGILDITVPKDSKENDTQIFNNHLLRPLHRDFIYDDHIVNLIQLAIGRGNKFVMLNSYGYMRIINEAAGDWDNGVWFSNSSYKYDWNDYGSYRRGKSTYYTGGTTAALPASTTTTVERWHNTDWEDESTYSKSRALKAAREAKYARMFPDQYDMDGVRDVTTETDLDDAWDHYNSVVNKQTKTLYECGNCSSSYPEEHIKYSSLWNEAICHLCWPELMGLDQVFPYKYNS